MRTLDESIAELKKTVKESGGKILSREILNVTTPVVFQCAYHHVFELEPFRVIPKHYFKNGKLCTYRRWCPKCRMYEGEYMPYEEYVQKKKFKYMSNVYAYLYKKKYTLLSGDVNSYEDILKIRCDKGHVFNLTYRTLSLSQGESSGCPDCRSNTYSLEDLNQFASSFGGKCLNDKYLSYGGIHLWQCKNGHIFTRKWRDMRKSKTFCFYCCWNHGAWRLPNKNQQGRIKAYVGKHGIKIDNNAWNKTSNFNS